MTKTETKLPAEVIAAGVAALASYPDDGPAEDLVATIYRAMGALRFTASAGG
jgi:hypothetical protein